MEGKCLQTSLGSGFRVFRDEGLGTVWPRFRIHIRVLPLDLSLLPVDQHSVQLDISLGLHFESGCCFPENPIHLHQGI